MIVATLLEFTDAAIDLTHGFVGLPTADSHNRAHLRRTAFPEKARSRPFVDASYSDYATVREAGL